MTPSPGPSRAGRPSAGERMRSIDGLVAPLLAVTAVGAASPLAQKAGEWLITEVADKDGKVISPIKACFRQKFLFEAFEKLENCGKKEIHTVGNVITADAICTSNETTV